MLRVVVMDSNVGYGFRTSSNLWVKSCPEIEQDLEIGQSINLNGVYDNVQVVRKCEDKMAEKN